MNDGGVTIEDASSGQGGGVRVFGISARAARSCGGGYRLAGQGERNCPANDGTTTKDFGRVNACGVVLQRRGGTPSAGRCSQSHVCTCRLLLVLYISSR